MRQFAKTVVAAALLVIPANSATGGGAATPEVAVLEAATRWAIPPQVSPAPGSLVYLSVGNREDPPDALLGRLQDIANLRKVSQCPTVNVGDTPYPKPEPGNLVILLHSLTWHGRHRASVWVVRYHGPLSASGCREYFSFTRGHWRHTDPGPNEGLECGVA